MFERAFQWTVRNGSRFLFAIAALLFAFTVSIDAWNATHQSYSPTDMALVIVAGIFAGVKDALLPLVAAIVIEHFHARLSHRDV